MWPHLYPAENWYCLAFNFTGVASQVNHMLLLLLLLLLLLFLLLLFYLSVLLMMLLLPSAGLILHCLDSYTTTPSHQFCSGALKLLSVLLMHRFRPHSPRSPGKRGLSDSLTVDPTQSPLSAALVHMLDGDLDQEEYTVSTVSYCIAPNFRGLKLP